jgi:membrane associated rhomboid family serine protease
MSLPPPPPPMSTPPTSSGMTCYRHPGREAGRRCTRCGKPACAECLVQATVGSHCVECAKASRPDIATRARYWQARQPAMVTTALMAINVLVYVYLVVRDPQALLGRQVTLGHAELALFEPAMAGRIDGVRLGSGEVVRTDGWEWYRLLTSGFIHFGLIHLGFNMYLLYHLGGMLERSIGRVRFLLIYLASLLGGSAMHLILTDGGFAGGASGAVFGLMGAAAIGFWLRGVNPFSTQIGTLLLLNLFITFVVPGISIGGHIGGLLAGLACGYVVTAPAHRASPVWLTYAAPVAIGLVAIAVSVVVVA